jgi:tetratricopeptide (TPR) repeat protein
MPVPEAQIEIPDIDVLDTPFKKLIACSAALLVLLGSLLALAASRASEQERTLSAHAQEQSITALADYGAAHAEISKLTGSDAEARTLRQRAEFARAASSLTGVDAYATAAQAWDRSARALANLEVTETGAAHYDDLNRKAADRLFAPRVTSLQADADRENATAWGAKADRYVLGITLLAVALALLGLSLTLAEGIRKLVVIPAVLIAGSAILVGVFAFAQHPSATPLEAVTALAEGDKQMTLGRFDAAITSYSRAIDLRSDYVQAYRARSIAHLRAGSSENGSYVVTTVDEGHRKGAISDLDRVLDLSPVPDYLALVNQGANLFHTRMYAESEALSRRAVESNDKLPLPYGNLALVLAAQGKADEARTTYDDMIERVADRPDPIERAELFSSARSALEILAKDKPERRELVQELEGRLVAGQAKLADTARNPAGADAKISGLTLTANGWHIWATYQQANLPAQSRVSWIGYFRRGQADAWEQRSRLVAIDRSTAASQGRRMILDNGCPGRGEYRLEAWLDDRLLASATAKTSTTAATQYVPFYDSSVRAWACRPADWSMNDAVPGQVRLSAPELGTEIFTVRTTPLPAELLGQPMNVVVGRALDTDPTCIGFGVPTAQAPGQVGGVPGVSRQYRQQKDGRAAWCWAGLGADNSLRVVVAQYRGNPDFVAPVSGAITQLYFDVRLP